MSFYVRRIHTRTGREGWVGPIRSQRQALREAAAWEAATDSFGDYWSADVFHSCPDVRRRVREWVKARPA
jgi:hypothetical protein